GERASGLVAIVPAGPENTTEHGKNSDRERTNCEHEKQTIKSARFMPLARHRVNRNRSQLCRLLQCPRFPITGRNKRHYFPRAVCQCVWRRTPPMIRSG